MSEQRARLDRPRLLAESESELTAAVLQLEAAACDRCGEGPHGRMILRPFAWLCRPCWEELRNSDGFIAANHDERERVWLAMAPSDVLADLVEGWARGDAP